MFNSLRKITTLAIPLATLLLALALPVAAQNRIIRGKVLNDKDEIVPNANVLIQGTDVKREYRVKTDKKGEYFYMGLPQGTYRIVVRAAGYQPNFVDNVRPSMAEESEVNIKLNPGSPDQKLWFEMTEAEREQLKKEVGKAQQQKEVLSEVRVAFEAGLKLAQEGKYDEAIVEYRKALEKDPEQANIHGNLAEALSQTEKFDEALAEYQKAIELKPDDSALYTNMGVLLTKMGKQQESQEAFKKAAAINPGSAAQNFYNLGATLVNSGKSADAAEAFKQAIAADPNFAEAYYQLGISLSGNPSTMPDAIKALEKYIQIGQKPDQVEVAKQLVAALKTAK